MFTTRRYRVYQQSISASYDRETSHLTVDHQCLLRGRHVPRGVYCNHDELGFLGCSDIRYSARSRHSSERWSLRHSPRFCHCLLFHTKLTGTKSSCKPLAWGSYELSVTLLSALPIKGTWESCRCRFTGTSPMLAMRQKICANLRCT